jgi:hypothetical protein
MDFDLARSYDLTAAVHGIDGRIDPREPRMSCTQDWKIRKRRAGDRVHVCDVSQAVDLDDGIGPMLGEGREAHSFVFDRTPLAHIGHQSDDEHILPRFERADAEFYRKHGTVLALSVPLAIGFGRQAGGPDHLAARIAGEKLSGFLRQQHPDIPANEFVALVAEEYFSLPVDELDSSLLIGDDNGVGR